MQYDLKDYQKLGMKIGQFWVDKEGRLSDGCKNAAYLLHSFDVHMNEYYAVFSRWTSFGMFMEIEDRSDDFMGASDACDYFGPDEVKEHLTYMTEINPAWLTAEFKRVVGEPEIDSTRDL